MAINLAEKYEPEILRKFTADSYLAGKVSNAYTFVGVKTIHISSIVTQSLADYSKTATSNRFGVIQELQDTMQELTLTQDKSFSISIDKANLQDGNNQKVAGKVLSAQLEEQSIPFIDAYAFKKYFINAGRSKAISAPAVGTILGLISDMSIRMDNDLVPVSGRFLYMSATTYGILRTATEVLAVDPLAEPAIRKGLMGTVMDFNVVKIPDAYFPNSAFYFLAMHKPSILLPIKFRTLRILTEDKDVDGVILQGRHYFDAFVLGEKANGVNCCVNASEKAVAVTITPTTEHHALTSAGATWIKYTLDGSDPRYSETAVSTVDSASIDLTSGQTIKACAYITDHCLSDVASATYTA
jgi:hypothetical protein